MDDAEKRGLQQMAALLMGRKRDSPLWGYPERFSAYALGSRRKAKQRPADLREEKSGLWPLLGVLFRVKRFDWGKGQQKLIDQSTPSILKFRTRSLGCKIFNHSHPWLHRPLCYKQLISNSTTAVQLMGFNSRGSSVGAKCEPWATS